MPDGTALATVRVPVMGSYGALDTGIPKERVDALRDALAAAGVENDVMLYEGAGHSFFNRAHLEPNAAEHSWQRSLGWFGRHLAS